MRRENQLLPEKWANPEDVILVDDITLSSSHRLANWSMLKDLFNSNPEIEIEPWGWNHALVRKFIDYGVPMKYLLTSHELEFIRELAHRRTTIKLNSEWNRKVEDALRVDIPCEISNVEACMEFYHENSGCWFKAPWSSSGRGVINTAADMNEKQICQWCHGIIRRQGSVIGETGADRVANFATEWRMQEGKANFFGLSMFETSRRGKYISNDILPQSELERKFNELSGIPLVKLVDTQHDIIEKKLAGYEGLLGIDMMIETNSKIRPFVEVNLRRTMGMLQLDYN